MSLLKLRWGLIFALIVLIPLSVWAVRDAIRKKDQRVDDARARVERERDELAADLETMLDGAGRALEAVPAGDAAALKNSLDALDAFDRASVGSARRDETPDCLFVAGGDRAFARFHRRLGELSLEGEFDLRAWIAKRSEGSDFRIVLVDADGRVVAASRATDESSEVDDEIARRTGMKVGGGDRFSVPRDPKEGLASGEPGVGEYEDAARDAWFGAWAGIAFSEQAVGGMVVELSRDEVFGDVGYLRLWHLTVALSILALLPLLLIELSRRWSASRKLLRLYSFVLPHWKAIIVVFLAMIAYAASEAGQIFLLAWMLDDVLLIGEGDPEAAWRTLVQIAILIGIVVSIMAVARYLREYLSAKVALGTITDLRCAIGAHLLTLSLGYFHRNRQSELLTRLTSDVDQSRKALLLVFGDLVQQPLMLAGAVTVAFATNPIFATILFVGVPIVALPLIRFGRKIEKHARRRQTKQVDVTNVMLQMLSGIRVVKAFRMEEREADRLRAASAELLGKELKVARTAARSNTVLELFNLVGASAIVVIGGYMVLHGMFGISPKDLIIFGAVLTKIYRPIKSITKTYNRVLDALPSVDRVFELMDIDAEIKDRPDAQTLERPADAIRFEDVTFAYDEEPVLRNVSFEVPVGSVVGLVGATGAGKSTLCDLVARFYDPTEGKVTVDGVDLRDYSLSSLHRNLAVVTQDPFLFNSSIIENIRYGRPDSTDEEVQAAARAAFIHDEIMEQPKGYDTLVGDRGVQLSGGQRQRVTIARAILKNAPILILDEATSALDSRSEGEVQRALANLMTDRTTFVIAHRLSTIREADLILVLERGRIVERGTHAELVEESGIYREYHDLQIAAPAADGG